jgi:chromosome segregation protein
LGRTSAKSLRADRMLEMIYHGGKGKKPAEAARVTLHFDNSEKIFPVEDEHLILSRRVNVNGVSIYKVNGRTVTREKVQEVLRKAHIQPDGHNIILQGDVTDIIERSPMGRREILDEISGIQEFEEKRNKSQRELTTVEERLKESSIILNEKDKNLKKLSREKKSAQEYEKLTKELDKLRASRASIKLKEAENAMKRLDDRISRADVNKVDEELNELDKKIEETEKESNEIGERLFDRTKDIAIIKEVEKLKADINLKKDKTRTNKLEIERIGNLIKRLEFLRKREMEKTISRAVREILNLNKEGIFGTIASLSKVPKEYQTAIEITAGRRLNDLVVSNENVAIESVNYLKKNKIGRATFLPLIKNILMRSHLFSELH